MATDVFSFCFYVCLQKATCFVFPFSFCPFCVCVAIWNESVLMIFYGITTFCDKGLIQFFTNFWLREPCALMMACSRWQGFLQD